MDDMKIDKEKMKKLEKMMEVAKDTTTYREIGQIYSWHCGRMHARASSCSSMTEQAEPTGSAKDVAGVTKDGAKIGAGAKDGVDPAEVDDQILRNLEKMLGEPDITTFSKIAQVYSRVFARMHARASSCSSMTEQAEPTGSAKDVAGVTKDGAKIGAGAKDGVDPAEVDDQILRNLEKMLGEPDITTFSKIAQVYSRVFARMHARASSCSSMTEQAEPTGSAKDVAGVTKDGAKIGAGAKDGVDPAEVDDQILRNLEKMLGEPDITTFSKIAQVYSRVFARMHARASSCSSMTEQAEPTGSAKDVAGAGAKDEVFIVFEKMCARASSCSSMTEQAEQAGRADEAVGYEQVVGAQGDHDFNNPLWLQDELIGEVFEFGKEEISGEESELAGTGGGAASSCSSMTEQAEQLGRPEQAGGADEAVGDD